MLAVPSESVQSLRGHLSECEYLKHFFLCEGGTGTYEAIDIINGVRLLNMPWTATGAHSSYMEVASEAAYPTGHHNVDLAAGSWIQPGNDVSIWLLCGKFDGIFSFGFGDSSPNNIEIVFSQVSGTTVYAAVKTNGNPTQNIPDWTEGRYTVSTLDLSVTSMVGLMINGTTDMTLFYTDTNGDYQSETEIFLESEPAFNPPATYSMGRDVVTSGGASGIVDLSGIAVFQFNSVPSDIGPAMEWMRSEWAAGRKRIWPKWLSSGL